jgi:hypothetical protein
LVEHTAENRGVAGSIPALATPSARPVLKDSLRVRPGSGPSGTTVAVRVARFSALAVFAGAVAVLVPSLGLSQSAPTFQQACPRVEHISGLEAVFGRRRTHQQAVTFRNTVVGRGFINANIIDECPGFKVVVRGIDTFTIGVDLQAEGRREGFPVTLECVQGKKIGRLEAIFGHPRDRAATAGLIARAEQQGMPGLKSRPDPCGGFEVYLAGFKDRAEAEAFAAQANRVGFNVVLERN